MEEEKQHMRKILIALVLIPMLFSGCAKHPSDALAPVIMKSAQVYHFANQTMIALYDACKMQGDRCPAALKPIVTNWNQIDDVCDQIDIGFMKAQDAWLEVSRLKSPESIEEFNRQWSVVTRLLDQLFGLVPGLKTTQVQTPMGVIELPDISQIQIQGGQQ